MKALRVLLEVGQCRAVGHHDRGAGGSLIEELGNVSCEIAGDDAGSSDGRQDHSGVQAVGSLVVLGPDQGLQPAPGVGVGGVNRVEVEPSPPDDGWNLVRQRDVAGSDAGQGQRALGRPDPVVDAWSGVVVTPGVVEQAQAGAGANLDQSQRLGQECERGKERGAAGDFVGLRPPGSHHPSDSVRVVMQPGQGLGGVLDTHVVPAQGAEEQVRLAFAGSTFDKNSRAAGSSATARASCS